MLRAWGTVLGVWCLVSGVWGLVWGFVLGVWGFGGLGYVVWCVLFFESLNFGVWSMGLWVESLGILARVS